MLPRDIDDSERLDRAIIAKWWIPEESRITSAAFKSNGCSVNRDGGRSDGQAISALLDSHPHIKAIARLTARFCREAGTYPVADPVKDTNPYHALILRTPTIAKLTPRQSRQLAQEATANILWMRADS